MDDEGSLTVGFTGSASKYFVTGFFGTVYGETTIENVTFRNITLNEPATDYVLSQTDVANKKINSRNCIGIIGGITDKGLSDGMPVNVTLRNITVENTVNIVAGATAGGLVGYIGGAGDGFKTFGTVTIEGCTVSAKLSSNYVASSNAYGPMGGFIGLMCRDDQTDVVFKGNNVFNGSVDGHQSVAAIIGDMLAAKSITFQGNFDVSGATLNAKGVAMRVANICAATEKFIKAGTDNKFSGLNNVTVNNAVNFTITNSGAGKVYDINGALVA